MKRKKGDWVPKVELLKESEQIYCDSIVEIIKEEFITNRTETEFSGDVLKELIILEQTGMRRCYSIHKYRNYIIQKIIG